LNYDNSVKYREMMSRLIAYYLVIRSDPVRAISDLWSVQ